MSNSGINFKVYCVNGDYNEVKRFFVDADAVTSFIFMKEKLLAVFPNLREIDFKITWKDADGDFISITGDDDLITALTEMQGDPKVLYISAEPRNMSEENQRQFRVVCNVCEKGISGYRYKCIECPDYDLCSTCEGNGHHSEHIVLRLPNSTIPIAKLDRKLMYNAARALKKSAFSAARDAHRCARESFRSAEKEHKSHHHHHQEAGQSTSAQNSSYQCPFAAADVGDMIAQNMNPIFEAFSKPPNQQEGNPISDLVRSVAEAFTGIVNATRPLTPTGAQSPNVPSEQNEENAASENAAQKKVQFEQATPTAPQVDNTNPQEMEWTLVNDSEDSVSQASGNSQERARQPPPPPQDPRLMRGLAQLYEMGFSNENQFLNYMLESHNYNVGDVVKAILELK